MVYACRMIIHSWGMIYMRCALVTGTSSGIGFEIACHLLKDGYEVYGISRSQADISHEKYHHLICDLTRHSDITECIRKLDKDKFDLIVNNAGVGYFGPHEEISEKKLHDMVTINFEAPMLITQLMLRSMKKNKGTIINISSVTAEQKNTYGCAYGATKAALNSFSESLFDEARKYGVKVVVIEPDMTKSHFYDNSNFCEGDEEDTYLSPVEVADTVISILNCREGAVITKIVLRPQRHKLTKR